jgi:hypothetical protein
MFPEQNKLNVFLVIQNVSVVMTPLIIVLFVWEIEPHHQSALNHHQRLNPQK